MILQGVTVTPGTELLILSGQLASLHDPAKPTAPASMATLTMAEIVDKKTQTIGTGKVQDDSRFARPHNGRPHQTDSVRGRRPDVAARWNR
ncbi:hypothetical protein KZX46_10680 [Polymorphobacter sp. PAMC 29334]|uniref:hypothetical protein n=1 Tax=Polymorphobacter sp. PAMC 29334 TaxID=2862331 RepID=UPI001C759677|nr:hypothetical protein [Polymorphobacter sp. PAMC 29334]QYE36345.1 hypothetical protein KZX46_10680 [Polymorphobacter sp. PAMC 29334]